MGPLGSGLGVGAPEEGTTSQNHRDLTGDRFQVTVSLFTHGQASKVISGYLGGIFCCFGYFGALKGVPGDMDG